MTEPRSTFFGIRTHHFVIALIAILVVVALRLELSSLVTPAMARERLYLFDTTLRDGAQTNGVDFTLADKLTIARMLDDLGVDYVEAGYPGANPTDTKFFAEKRPSRATAHRLRHDARAPAARRPTIPGCGAS